MAFSAVLTGHRQHEGFGELQGAVGAVGGGNNQRINPHKLGYIYRYDICLTTVVIEPLTTGTATSQREGVLVSK
jgi:hypothetical protein